jgi:hypothetical protein
MSQSSGGLTIRRIATVTSASPIIWMADAGLFS